MLASASIPQSHAFHSSLSPGYHMTLSAMSSGYRSLYLDRADLNQEEVRQQTFLLWPKWAPKSVTKESMAKAGLYFTGDSDIVKCFQCKVGIGRWKEGDIPLERHRLQAPHCEFLASFENAGEDDLVVDGDYERGEMDEREDDDDEEDCIDGATAEIHSRSSSIKHDFRPLVTLPDENSSTSKKDMNSSKVDKTQLKNENDQLRKAMICRNCKTERIQTLFLPCRHLVTCEECAERMDDCIECRQRILGTVRTFMV